jgi:hypothetical protein
VLERLVRRMERHLRRCGRLRIDEDEAEPHGGGGPRREPRLGRRRGAWDLRYGWST